MRRLREVPSRFPCASAPRRHPLPCNFHGRACEHRPEALYSAGPQVKLHPATSRNQHDFAPAMIDACQKYPLRLAAWVNDRLMLSPAPDGALVLKCRQRCFLLFLFPTLCFSLPLHHPTSIPFFWYARDAKAGKGGPWHGPSSLVVRCHCCRHHVVIADPGQRSQSPRRGRVGDLRWSAMLMRSDDNA
jgi:hypothetical protein